MVDDRQQHIDTEDVRAGETPHVVRYVLGISFAAAVLLLAIILILQISR